MEEKSTSNCNNFLIDGKCDQWIIDRYSFGNVSGIVHTGTEDDNKADEICGNCRKFEKKGS